MSKHVSILDFDRYCETLPVDAYFTIPLPALGIGLFFIFFNFLDELGGKMISHYYFNLQFSDHWKV